MTKSFAMLVLLFWGAALTTDSASAQGFETIKRDALPKVEPFKSRRRVQVVREDPIVTYHGDEEPEKVYVIPTALPKGRGKEVIYLPSPQAADGGGSITSGDRAGYFTMPSNFLPKSRLGTNIPTGGPAKPKGLSAGYSTNILGRANPGESAVQKSLLVAPPSASRSSTNAREPQLLKYDAGSTGLGSGASERSSSANVYGEVKKTGRGNLLK
ncbi:MAG TPA: hypothetical protein V6D17_04855 [Candidatus Obscuribacterales bacterium]